MFLLLSVTKSPTVLLIKFNPIFDGRRQYILGGMAGSGTAVSFNGGRCIVNRILDVTSEPDDYPENYFSPVRLLDPSGHRWPELEPDD